MKLAHLLLKFINFYNLPSILMSSHFTISEILRSNSLNFEPLKILEAPDPATRSTFQEMGIFDYTSMKTSKIFFCTVHQQY
jgi:hypothetical protein